VKVITNSNNVTLGNPPPSKKAKSEGSVIEVGESIVGAVTVTTGSNNLRMQYPMMMDFNTMLQSINNRGFDKWWSTTEKEKLIHGESNLLPSSFLSTAQDRSSAVAYIDTSSGVGSGFMVSDQLLMTARHVLPSKEAANSAVVIFDYNDEVPSGARIKDVYNKTAWTLDPSLFFIENEELDVAVVALKCDNKDQKSTWKPIPIRVDPILRDQKDEKANQDTKANQALNIIQHPEGRPKRFAFRGWKVKSLSKHLVEYDTDTMEGSSGSPVFNDFWELVAVHHGARKDLPSNLGTHIAFIMEFIRKGNYTTAQKELLAKLNLGNNSSGQQNGDKSQSKDSK